MSDKMVLTPMQRLKMLKENGAVLLPSLSKDQRANALYINDEPGNVASIHAQNYHTCS